GRYRQFWQIGAESLGVATPESEAENLIMLMEFLGELGLEHLSLSINSVGTPQSRPAFYAALRTFFEARQERFCADCHRRIESNPLRVLDCKVPTCQAALEGHPLITDYLDEGSLQHHARLKALLTTLNVPFVEDPRLVRGLDYYTRTAFEVLSADLGAQSALLGGGRYDGLVKHLGGPEVPAFGWALGLDRLAMLLQQLKGPAPEMASAVLVPLGEAASLKALELARQWWKQGLTLRLETRGVNLKKALTSANRMNTRLALILGDGELERGVVAAKDLTQGTQVEWAFDEVPARWAESLAEVRP
ncbi:MAG: histidine--tRNA ligase, partial [Firmicutes bacterium]|nr:histidine--tRNA ligase [Bacillota bacterium]